MPVIRIRRRSSVVPCPPLLEPDADPLPSPSPADALQPASRGPAPPFNRDSSNSTTATPTPPRRDSVPPPPTRPRARSRTLHSIFGDAEAGYGHLIDTEPAPPVAAPPAEAGAPAPLPPRKSSVVDSLRSRLGSVSSAAGAGAAAGEDSAAGGTRPRCGSKLSIGSGSGRRRDRGASIGSVVGQDLDTLHHPDEVVEHLDVIDPQIAAIGHLQNAANTILLPPLPSLYSRVPSIPLPTTSPLSDPEKGKMVGEEDEELDEYVHELLTRRHKFKRGMRGVWAFLKTPLGILVGIYGLAVVFWGSAIVLFLVRWIDLHNDRTQKKWIEISCQVTNFLFCTGIILIPWRVRDTYRIVRIWHYAHLTSRRRRARGLPPLKDKNDLPRLVEDADYEPVLSVEEQRRLEWQQEKFAESNTYYRAHESETHKAFPITFALWICIFADGNSLFQCMLSGAMWGYWGFSGEPPKYDSRPPALTGLGVGLSFLCGALAGILTWRGGARSKKTEEVTQKLRAALALPVEDGWFGARDELVRIRTGKDGEGEEGEECKEKVGGEVRRGAGKAHGHWNGEGCALAPRHSSRQEGVVL